MKKLIALVLALVCVLGLVGCTMQSEYAIKIVVPAGSQAVFIYSDEEISPRKSRLEIKSIDMPENAEFVLKPVEITQENAYECTDFPKGEPMLIEVEKGAWYKIGIAMENPTDEDIVVVFHAKNVKVRIESIPIYLFKYTPVYITSNKKSQLHFAAGISLFISSWLFSRVLRRRGWRRRS